MESPVSNDLRWLLGVTLIGYTLVMYLLAFVAQRKIVDSQDYLVAGRRLPLSLAWMTLLATWFGAGTLVTATDEVRKRGISAATLDPLGAGICLLLAGAFVARPIWQMKLLTICDLFRTRFDARTEFLSALISVPAYFGWVAAQFYALAGMLELFFDIDPRWGLLLVAVVGTGYTLLGGMWSVTLTDAVQVSLVLVGLLVLVSSVLWRMGDGSLLEGFTSLTAQTSQERLTLIPTESAGEFFGWLNILLIGALGNLPVQDLHQRIFAARSANVARQACFVAGVAYLAFGAIPVTLGLASAIVLPEGEVQSTIANLAHTFLTPPLAVVFTLVVISAVLSTIDSAILAPAGIVAQNILSRWSKADPLRLNHLAVLGVSGCSLFVAYLGEDAYALLEQSYAVGLVALLVPMAFALYTTPRRPLPGFVSMLVGFIVWTIHLALAWETFLAGVPGVSQLRLPADLACAASSLVAYLLCEPPWKIRWGVARPLDRGDTIA